MWPSSSSSSSCGHCDFVCAVVDLYLFFIQYGNWGFRSLSISFQMALFLSKMHSSGGYLHRACTAAHRVTCWNKLWGKVIPWFLGYSMLTYCPHSEAEMAVAGTLSPFDRVWVTVMPAGTHKRDIGETVRPQLTSPQPPNPPSGPATEDPPPKRFGQGREGRRTCLRQSCPLRQVPLKRTLESDLVRDGDRANELIICRKRYGAEAVAEKRTLTLNGKPQLRSVCVYPGTLVGACLVVAGTAGRWRPSTVTGCRWPFTEAGDYEFVPPAPEVAVRVQVRREEDPLLVLERVTEGGERGMGITEGQGLLWGIGLLAVAVAAALAAGGTLFLCLTGRWLFEGAGGWHGKALGSPGSPDRGRWA